MSLQMRTAKKLAIFFTTIPREKAIEILKHFSVKNMELIASEIRSIGPISQEMQAEVFQEVSERLAQGVNPVGGEEVAHGILSGVVGEEEARKLMERAKPRKPAPFSTIQNVKGQDLATILSNEQSATASIILSYFSPKKVAEILSYLDEEKREEIVVRLAMQNDADYEIVERIEEIFVEKVTSSISSTDDGERKSTGGPDFVAEIFQNIDKNLEEEMMTTLQDESPELADQIRDLMFTFEDVKRLSDPDIQKVLREIPSEKLVIALRGSSQEVIDKFLKNLSKRAQENLMEEMDLMGKMKKSEIEGERKAIVSTIRALEAAGTITVSTGGDDDVYV
jgi:flagellar motor switch protein FliG